MADVPMQLSLRTKDGRVVKFTDEAFPSDMTIGQVLMEAQRLCHVAHNDVKLKCYETEVIPFKAKLKVMASAQMEARKNGTEITKEVTLTTGFEKTKSDETGGSSSNEISASLTVGWSGAFVSASATASFGSTTSSNWSSSRSQSVSQSETTTLLYSFPNGVFTQYCRWYVNVPHTDDKTKFRQFFLPGPMVAFTDGKDHEGFTMDDVQARQPKILMSLSAGKPVEGGKTADSTPEPKKNTWFKIVNKDGNCLTFPGESGSSSKVQLEVQSPRSGFYSQQWSWAGEHLDKLECRHNLSKRAGSGEEELFVAVWHASGSNGAAVGMYKNVSVGSSPTWQSQKWTRDADGSLVNGCGLILTTKKDGDAGSKVHLWEDLGQDGQTWTFDYIVEDGN